MEVFDRISRYRYSYPNNYSSVKFIDFMITDLDKSVVFEIPQELKTVAAIIRKVFGYSRYEPTNPYAFHKRVPSARNVHTNEAYLICDGNICRYNCKKDIFESIRYCSKEKGNTRLVVAAELWRIMKFYGEFGLVLPLLDVGHILALLKMELEAAGLTDVEILYGAEDNSEYERLGLSQKSNLITLEIKLDKVAACKLGERIVSISRRTMNYDTEVSAYEMADKILPFEKGFHRRKMVYDQNALKPFGEVHKRESAHNRIGICSLEETVPEETVKGYTNQLAAYMNHYMEDVSRYKVYMLYTTSEGQRMMRIIGGCVTKITDISIEKRRLIHDTERMIDMESMPLITYVSYIYDDSLSEKENIYNAHIGAAEVIHYLMLNAPKDGYFERPMRNLEDAYLEKIFATEESEHFMYSVIVGKANSKNYVYSL